MVYIVERHVEDYLHVLANVNTIKIFERTFAHEQICFISAAAHNLKVKAYFYDRDKNIVFEEFKNRKPTKFALIRMASLIKRAFDDILFFNKLLKKAQLTDTIVVSHIYPHSLIFFSILKRIYQKKIVLVMLHGEIEYAVFPKSITQKLVGFLYKFSFKIRPLNFKYIFLTKASAQIVAEKQLMPPKDVIAIELPTFTGLVNVNFNNTEEASVIKIGHIGSAGKRKNVDQFYELAVHLGSLIDAKLLQLCLVGVLEESIKPYLNFRVSNYVNDQINVPIERATYDLEVSKLNYSIFFYGEHDFLLRSSAAIFDAIAYEKPMIVLKNKFFNDLFKQYGPMGYLCDDLDEMEQIITFIVSERKVSSAAYNEFIENIRHYKIQLQVDVIADDLKRQLKILIPDLVVQ